MGIAPATLGSWGICIIWLALIIPSIKMGECEGAKSQAKSPAPKRNATTKRIRARIKKANLATKLLDCKKSVLPCKYLLDEKGFIKPLAPSDTFPYCESAIYIYTQLFLKTNLLKKG
jgi:hypothetical protein